MKLITKNWTEFINQGVILPVNIALKYGEHAATSGGRTPRGMAMS